MNMYELLRKIGEDALSEECRTVFEREYGIVDPQIMAFHHKNHSNKWQWVLLFNDVDWGFERKDIPRRTVAWRKSLLREKLVSFVQDLLDGIYSNRPGLRTRVKMLLELRGFKMEDGRAEEQKAISRLHIERTRAVLKLDMDGNVLERFDCIKDAAKSVGTCHSVISRVCSGERKQALGFVWKYE